MNKTKFLQFFIISCIFNLCPLHAQSNMPADSTLAFFPGVYRDIKTGLSDGVKLITAPASFDQKDWIITAGIIGGTALSFLADTNIRNGIHNHHTKGMNNFTDIGKYYGNGLYPAILGGLIYFSGKAMKNNDVASTGRMMIESLVYAGIITTILKVSLGRSRPYMNEGNTHFLGFQLNNDNMSFPSGHVTVAFAVSSVLAAKIDNVYASVFLFGLAGLTAFQRIYEDQHWFSDTVFAATVSTIVGRAIVNYDEDREKERNGSSISFYPVIQSHGLGLGAAYSF